MVIAFAQKKHSPIDAGANGKTGYQENMALHVQGKPVMQI
ncbi:hypothetical protein DFR38_1018 [Aquitalea magnusonii]|uniref:Uncharacterized protein n=1 Tax=Aquitalea magnusonii TaxID=332411 RepID=A0A318JQ61_9NEIS|nr:hypothetical protein DFR38_1018 [Aquitalea magnusonii]